MDHLKTVNFEYFPQVFSQQWHTHVKENYLMQLVFKFQPLWCTHFWENGERRMLDFGPRGRVKYIIWDDVITYSMHNYNTISTYPINLKSIGALKAEIQTGQTFCLLPTAHRSPPTTRLPAQMTTIPHTAKGWGVKNKFAGVSRLYEIHSSHVNTMNCMVSNWPSNFCCSLICF